MSFKVTIRVFFDDLNNRGSSYVIDLSCSHFAVRDTHLMIKILNTVELSRTLQWLHVMIPLTLCFTCLCIRNLSPYTKREWTPLSQAPSKVYLPLPLPLLDSYLSLISTPRAKEGKTKERKGRYRFSKRILIPTKGRNGYHISLSSLSNLR